VRGRAKTRREGWGVVAEWISGSGPDWYVAMKKGWRRWYDKPWHPGWVTGGVDPTRRRRMGHGGPALECFFCRTVCVHDPGQELRRGGWSSYYSQFSGGVDDPRDRGLKLDLHWPPQVDHNPRWIADIGGYFGFSRFCSPVEKTERSIRSHTSHDMPLVITITPQHICEITPIGLIFGVGPKARRARR
jgi:hypothetical protein